MRIIAAIVVSGLVALAPCRTLAASLANLFTSLPPEATARLPRLPGDAPTTPGSQCRAAIRAAEQAYAIPPSLMAAIGRIESGRANADGRIDPWPWSINANGIDQVFDTKPAAIAAVRALQAAGTASIDVGCMQVNLRHHPDAFPTLDDAFDPQRNANYAATFLQRLHAQTGNWPAATAWYHSATPELGGPYAAKVMAVLPAEQAVAVAPGAATGPAVASAGGGQSLNNGAAAARVLTLAPGSGGRGLAAYRAAPVMVAGPARAVLPLSALHR